MTTINETTKTDKGSIPKWIIWYTIIIVIGTPLLYGIMNFMGPDLGMKTLADGSVIDTAVFKYSVRNLAAATIAIIALWKRSAAMLYIVYIMRFITESGDLLDAFIFGEMETTALLSYAAMMVFIALIPYTIAILKLKSLWHTNK